MPATDLGREISGEESFTVKLRQTRMGVPDADLVLIRRVECGQPSVELKVSVDGKELPKPWVVFADGAPGTCVDTFYVIPASEFAGGRTDVKQVTVKLTGPTVRSYFYKFYLTRDFREIPEEHRAAYEAALMLELAHDWKAAQTAFRALGAKDPEGPLGRLCRMRARYSEYKIKSLEPALSARSRYLLGLYCMENGFWEAAADEFERATQLDPKNPDAWYMLADARAYRDGDLGDQVEPLVPLYRKSAELRDAKPNIWTNYVGIFKKMWVWADDGKGGRTKKLMEMSQANVERIQKEWGWMSDILWAASRGSMKFNNIIKVHDEPFDNTDQHAFDKLWKPGEVDTFMKFFEGGPAEALGHDCGPNRSAVVDIGTWCGWEVYLHEWNHTLDWSMITSENGKGVPVTHSSDWCGFQPIPSMGRGHASCNHYYMTPGMFRAVKGSDTNRNKPYLTSWILYGPFECKPGEGLKTEFIPETTTEFPKDYALDTEKKHLPGPWIDLKKLLAPKSDSVVAYAVCYVYSPVRQKARMWLGMNDAIKVWINGRLAYGGIYKAIVRFDEANEPDQVVPAVMLEKGWNSVLVKVENLPKTPDQLKEAGKTENGWGFSMRFCGMANESLLGLKAISARPSDWKAPHVTPDAADRRLYRWDDVADDYTTKLPRLSEKDLAAWTGLPDITITNQVVITTTGKHGDQRWVEGYDQEDRLLNNELNWRFESAAVLRYLTKKNKPRDLVFLRPEAYETYLRMMKSEEGLRGKKPSSRVLGYVIVGGLDDHPNGRIMLVVDTYLGRRLPADEKELLDISAL